MDIATYIKKLKANEKISEDDFKIIKAGLVEFLSNNAIMITHRNCMDGLFSAIVLNYFLHENNIPSNSVQIVFQQYGFDIPQLHNSNILMADFTFGPDVTNDLKNLHNDIIIIDHHVTAKDLENKVEKAYFYTEHCGSVLLWKFLFNNADVPLILKYIEDRDLWKWRLKNSKQISEGLQHLLEFNTVPDIELVKKLLTGEAFEKIKKTGIIIHDMNNKIIKKNISSYLYKSNTLELTDGMDTYHIPVMNNAHLISELGNELAKLSEPMMSIQYFIVPDKIIFSMRSIGDNDIGKICKSYGGGGHKNAGGFSIRLKDLDLQEFFMNSKIKLLS